MNILPFSSLFSPVSHFIQYHINPRIDQLYCLIVQQVEVAGVLADNAAYLCVHVVYSRAEINRDMSPCLHKGNEGAASSHTVRSALTESLSFSLSLTHTCFVSHIALHSHSVPQRIIHPLVFTQGAYSSACPYFHQLHPHSRIPYWCLFYSLHYSLLHIKHKILQK